MSFETVFEKWLQNQGAEEGAKSEGKKDLQKETGLSVGGEGEDEEMQREGWREDDMEGMPVLQKMVDLPSTQPHNGLASPPPPPLLAHLQLTEQGGREGRTDSQVPGADPSATGWTNEGTDQDSCPVLPEMSPINNSPAYRGRPGERERASHHQQQSPLDDAHLKGKSGQCQAKSALTELTALKHLTSPMATRASEIDIGRSPESDLPMEPDSTSEFMMAHGRWLRTRKGSEVSRDGLSPWSEISPRSAGSVGPRTPSVANSDGTVRVEEGGGECDSTSMFMSSPSAISPASQGEIEERVCPVITDQEDCASPSSHFMCRCKSLPPPSDLMKRDHSSVTAPLKGHLFLKSCASLSCLAKSASPLVSRSHSVEDDPAPDLEKVAPSLDLMTTTAEGLHSDHESPPVLTLPEQEAHLKQFSVQHSQVNASAKEASPQEAPPLIRFGSQLPRVNDGSSSAKCMDSPPLLISSDFDSQDKSHQSPPVLSFHSQEKSCQSPPVLSYGAQNQCYQSPPVLSYDSHSQDKTLQSPPVLNYDSQNQCHSSPPVLRSDSRDKSHQSPPVMSSDSKDKLHQSSPVLSSDSKDRSHQIPPVLSSDSKDKSHQSPPVLRSDSKDKSQSAPVLSSDSKDKLHQSPPVLSSDSNDKSHQIPPVLSSDSTDKSHQSPPDSKSSQSPPVMRSDSKDKSHQSLPVLSSSAQNQCNQSQSVLSSDAQNQCHRSPPVLKYDSQSTSHQNIVLSCDSQEKSHECPSALSYNSQDKPQQSAPALSYDSQDKSQQSTPALSYDSEDKPQKSPPVLSLNGQDVSAKPCKSKSKRHAEVCDFTSNIDWKTAVVETVEHPPSLTPYHGESKPGIVIKIKTKGKSILPSVELFSEPKPLAKTKRKRHTIDNAEILSRLRKRHKSEDGMQLAITEKEVQASVGSKESNIQQPQAANGDSNLYPAGLKIKIPRRNTVSFPKDSAFIVACMELSRLQTLTHELVCVLFPHLRPQLSNMTPESISFVEIVDDIILSLEHSTSEEDRLNCEELNCMLQNLSLTDRGSVSVFSPQVVLCRWPRHVLEDFRGRLCRLLQLLLPDLTMSLTRSLSHSSQQLEAFLKSVVAANKKTRVTK